MTGRPGCIKCVHYYVTHDPAKPHGCRAMGFKAAQNPATLVFASSGIECQLFRKKQTSNTNNTDDSRGGIVA